MERKKIGTKYKVLIAIFLIIFFILYTLVYIFPSIGNKFKNTYVAEYGSVSLGIKTEYLVIRDESLVLSNNSGEVTRNVVEGELVRSDTSVLKVGSKSYSNENRGIISYCSDGLEDTYSVDSLEGLKEEELTYIKGLMTDEKGKRIEILKTLSEDLVEVGDPLFKVIDNTKWYAILWVTREDAAKLSEGSRTKVKFDNSDESISMRVESIYQESNSAEIILSSSNYYENFDKMRIGECEIITDEETGIILETSSIVTIGDGTSGVYIINKSNEKIFRPINILLSTKDKTVVSRNYFYDSNGDYTYTVKMYDTILRK